MSYPPIGTLVPHAAPMLLLDRVLVASQETLCAEVRIRETSQFFDGGGVGSWVGIEYMAQAVAAHAGYLAQQRGEPVKVGFLLGARRYDAATPQFALGALLLVRIQLVLRGENGLAAFECGITDAGDASGACLAQATLTVYQPENVNDFLQENSNGSAA